MDNEVTLSHIFPGSFSAAISDVVVGPPWSSSSQLLSSQQQAADNQLTVQTPQTHLLSLTHQTYHILDNVDNYINSEE